MRWMQILRMTRWLYTNAPQTTVGVQPPSICHPQADFSALRGGVCGQDLHAGLPVDAAVGQAMGSATEKPPRRLIRVHSHVWMRHASVGVSSNTEMASQRGAGNACVFAGRLLYEGGRLKDRSQKPTYHVLLLLRGDSWRALLDRGRTCQRTMSDTLLN